MGKRWRIRKCCSLCGHWELVDRHKPVGQQIKRFPTWEQAINRMDAIVAIELYNAGHRSWPRR